MFVLHPLRLCFSPILTDWGGVSRGLARAWIMPLKAMISHMMTWLTTTAPGAYGETAIRPSR